MKIRNPKTKYQYNKEKKREFFLSKKKIEKEDVFYTGVIKEEEKTPPSSAPTSDQYLLSLTSTKPAPKPSSLPPITTQLTDTPSLSSFIEPDTYISPFIRNHSYKLFEEAMVEISNNNRKVQQWKKLEREKLRELRHERDKELKVLRKKEREKNKDKDNDTNSVSSQISSNSGPINEISQASGAPSSLLLHPSAPLPPKPSLRILTKLDLSHQLLLDEHLTRLSQSIIQYPLKSINLSGNKFTDEGMKSYAKVHPTLSQLESLNFSSNLFTDMSVALLANPNCYNSSLQVLDLTYNVLSSASAYYLSFLLNSTLPTEALHTLRLGGRVNGKGWGDEFLMTLTYSLLSSDRVNQLKHLYISDFGLTVRGYYCLMSILLSDLIDLQSLNISQNMISSNSVRDLFVKCLKIRPRRCQVLALNCGFDEETLTKASGWYLNCITKEVDKDYHFYNCDNPFKDLNKFLEYNKLRENKIKNLNDNIFDSHNSLPNEKVARLTSKDLIEISEKVIEGVFLSQNNMVKVQREILNTWKIEFPPPVVNFVTTNDSDLISNLRSSVPYATNWLISLTQRDLINLNNQASFTHFLHEVFTVCKLNTPTVINENTKHSRGKSRKAPSFNASSKKYSFNAATSAKETQAKIMFGKYSIYSNSFNSINNILDNYKKFAGSSFNRPSSFLLDKSLSFSGAGSFFNRSFNSMNSFTQNNFSSESIKRNPSFNKGNVSIYNPEKENTKSSTSQISKIDLHLKSSDDEKKQENNKEEENESDLIKKLKMISVPLSNPRTLLYDAIILLQNKILHLEQLNNLKLKNFSKNTDEYISFLMKELSKVEKKLGRRDIIINNNHKLFLDSSNENLFEEILFGLEDCYSQAIEKSNLSIEIIGLQYQMRLLIEAYNNNYFGLTPINRVNLNQEFNRGPVDYPHGILLLNMPYSNSLGYYGAFSYYSHVVFPDERNKTGV